MYRKDSHISWTWCWPEFTVIILKVVLWTDIPCWRRPLLSCRVGGGMGCARVFGIRDGLWNGTSSRALCVQGTERWGNNQGLDFAAAHKHSKPWISTSLFNSSTSCAYWIKWGGGIGCAEAFWDSVFLILIGKILISWRSLVQALNKLEPNYRPIFRWL